MQVIPAPFTKLAAAIEETQAVAAARDLARSDPDSEYGASADSEAEVRFETEQREITLNSEFLQCAAFLQAMPNLGVPLHIFEYADLYRSLEAEAFIEACDGHEVLESEEAPSSAPASHGLITSMPTPDYNPLMPYLTFADRDRDYALQHRERLRDLRNKLRCLEGQQEKYPLTARQSATILCLRHQLRTEAQPEPAAPSPARARCRL